MVLGQILKWKENCSEDLVRRIDGCGRIYGKFFLRCGQFACRRCRIERINAWYWNDISWTEGRSRLRYFEARANPGNDLRAAIVREKSRLRSFLARSGGSARGYCTIDDAEMLVLKGVIDLGEGRERQFRESLAKLWPGAVWAPFDGDFVPIFQPLATPLAGFDPVIKARFFNALAGRGFRRMRISFGGKEREKKIEEKVLEPMAVTF